MSAKIIIPSSGTIDLYDDVPLPITYSIADIKEPDKRNGSYSKTIRVPGTANNNRMFGNIFNINVSLTTFDPNKKISCFLSVNDIAVIYGYLQLSNILVLDDSHVEYEVFILGQASNPFNAMGNSELTDLDFSEFSHSYSYANQIASWSNTWENGYCYPLIDYGIDSDTSRYDVEDFQPAIFVKQYFKKILESIGYTYTSSFLDSSFFEQLIIPCNAQKLVFSAAEVAGFLFEADQATQSSGTTTGGNFPFTSAWFDVVYDSEVLDVSNQYNPITGEWTVLNSGYYNVYADGTFSYSTSGSLGGANPQGELGVWVDRGSGYVLAGSNNSIYPIGVVAVNNVFLASGDKVKIRARANFAQGSSGLITMAVGGGSFYNSFVNNGIIEGNTLNLNNAIPLKIKQKDFFMSIVKMFNLYIDLDTLNPQNLIIETRDDYYASGDIVDWSAKLDYNSPIDSVPMGALDFKEILWNYTDDSDYYNKLYSDKWKETYGLKRFVTENEFQTAINETKVIFSPTPLINDNSSDRIIPYIWSVDSSNSVSHKSFNIRILYNGGVKNTSYPYNYSGRFSGNHTQTQYLYAGHLDSPQNPTLDLSFGVPREVFYDTTVYTNNTLFNRFYARQIEQISSIDSRIVTARFHLKLNDINSLSFQNIFVFDNQYFRLNEIKDYDPMSEETVECVFLKLITPIGPTINQTQLNGGSVDDFEEGYPFIEIL